MLHVSKITLKLLSALLQAQGIAPPPTPEPVPPSPSSEVRADSPEVEIKEEGGNEEETEIRQLQVFTPFHTYLIFLYRLLLQARINALKKRKRPVEGKTKAEPVARRPRLSDPEGVIDLTSE
jgi:hypothetical protein